MAIKRVYKNTLLNSQYLFANGKSAHFVAGRYETSDPNEIAELDREINNGVPHLYIDPEDSTRDTGKEDFVRERQKQATIDALREYEAKQGKGAVTGNLLADPQTGLPHVPGASEEQQRAHVDTPDTTVKTGEEGVKDAEVKPVVGNANLAQLLAARANQASEVKKVDEPLTAKNTGIASSLNAPQ